MIRIAAVGDVHFDRRSNHRMREHFRSLEGSADLLFLAGDLTQSGDIEEGRALVEDLRESPVPVVIVLGNHDFHQGCEQRMIDLFRKENFATLEGESVYFHIRDQKIGIVGMKGFCGGFIGSSITEFGEPEVKNFARKAREQAEILQRELAALEADYRFVLLHFSPVEGTLEGERREIFPFLGNYQLAEAVDRFGVDCVFHGHAHLGSEWGVTPGGVPVRNVAQPVIRHAYKIYRFDHSRKRDQAGHRSLSP